MIEDEHFGGQRQSVSQGLTGIVHFVQAKLEVHDIATWRSCTEVRLNNLHSIFEAPGGNPRLPLPNGGGVLVNDDQFLGFANQVGKRPATGSNPHHCFAGKM